MAKLKADGTELVTNILVAADARELKRREELREANRLRLEKLENEVKSSTEKFNKIMNKWTEAKTTKIHQKLRDNLRQQQQLCWQVIEDKNKLINELQQRERAVNHYPVFVCEQLEFLLQRMKMLEEHESLLDHLRIQSAEEYKKLKIKLISDVQVHCITLTTNHPEFSLNVNYLPVATIRLNSNWKELLFTFGSLCYRLQDMRNNLKKECADQKKQSRQEIQSMTNKYNRLVQQYNDIQKRNRHFALVDGKRYEEVWLMKEDEAKALVRRAVGLDRAIYEQVLGLTWSPPTLPFMDHSSPSVQRSMFWERRTRPRVRQSEKWSLAVWRAA
ncbi:hypothetical protein QTP86_034350 [Hemibagrus guttatus]|nr:hypothetical protein QTP86_034350 [Hemibagrus guttatus]